MGLVMIIEHGVLIQCREDNHAQPEHKMENRLNISRSVTRLNNIAKNYLIILIA